MIGRGLDETDTTPAARELDVAWIHGSRSAKHNTDPDIQVYAYDEHTVIMRQNMAIDCEAPFMFLLFGDARAVLIDTGATESAQLFPLREVVDQLIDGWLARHPRDGYGLLVLHTHAHGDHFAGDAQFADRPETRVIAADWGIASDFFGFDADRGVANEPAYVDLGDRVLECLATPGHDKSAVTFYDPWTGLLLTGDTVYPGRLYVDDWPAFRDTIDRLIAFTASRPITHLLGCHIEMSTEPGVDYPARTTYQPHEVALQMTVAQLHDIRAALAEIGDQPARRYFPDFVIWPEDD
jgi:hydroxyacylglutathione hydrolase